MMDLDRDPVVVFWELTRACALACRHCRASAQPKADPRELDAATCRRVLRQMTEFDHLPIVVFSGGDPFMRRDLFDLVEYGISLGFTISVSPSATALVTEQRLRRLAELGVSRVSFSLDGASAATHDAFRGFGGTYERTRRAFATARDAGLSFQVNTTVTRQTRPELPAMAELMSEVGAVLWDLFFLVPTGRGMANDMLSPREHEDVFQWIASNARSWPFRAKTTLGQPYRRVFAMRKLQREGRADLAAVTPGDIRRLWPGPPTNDGQGIFFISHTGEIYPSGFLPIAAGRVPGDHVVEVYRNAPLFTRLRDRSQLNGKCGACPFNVICGGCRARAYAVSGDPMGSEPNCVFQPAA